MEESPHKCPVCGRTFNQRSNLRTHLLTHTTSQTIQKSQQIDCQVCRQSFHNRDELTQHELTVHYNHNSQESIVTSSTTTLLDLSSKTSRKIVESPSTLTTPVPIKKKPLGFSIEDIMRR